MQNSTQPVVSSDPPGSGIRHVSTGPVSLLLFCALLLLPCIGHGEDFEQGRAAYRSRDYARALEILRPLAEDGNSQAQVTLGIMYDYGHGVQKDPSEALKWYIRAAEQGIPVVQHDVGVKYFQGTGVERDYLEAARWWEQSAEAGLADSQFNLGLLYYRGLGVEQNNKKAADLFLKAAEQGNGHAQYSLAVMYAFGQGIDKDYKEAFNWFSKSAAQDVVQAQFNLGIFYENGYGVTRDIETARHWYEKAYDQGLAEAGRKLASLGTDKAPESTPVKNGTTDIAETEAVTLPESTAEKIVTDTSSINIPDNSNDWAMQQRPDTYTLQLASLLNKEDIVKFIRENDIGTEAAYMRYVRVFVKNNTRYSVLYGVYENHEAAKAAVGQLPEKLRKNNPWIRDFGTLQKLMEN